MNLLIESAPDYITVGGVDYKIKTDFVVWVRFLIAVEEREKSKVEESVKPVVEEIENLIQSSLTNSVTEIISCPLIDPLCA